MKKLGIIELLTRIGEDNVKLQNVVGSATNFQLKKGDTAITFLTDQITPTEVAVGPPRNIGLVLWLPAALVKIAQDDFAKDTEGR